MAKRKVGNQVGSLTPDQLKPRIDPTTLCASGMQHAVENLSTKTIILLQTSSQSEVCTQSYEATNLQESHFGNFGTPSWESWDKMSFGCGLWRGIEYTIRGKVVVSPKSGLW
jgi:hypothetical protein